MGVKNEFIPEKWRERKKRWTRQRTCNIIVFQYKFGVYTNVNEISLKLKTGNAFQQTLNLVIIYFEAISNTYILRMRQMAKKD